MHFVEILSKFQPNTLFSLSDVEKSVTSFNRRQFNHWEKQNYVKQIRPGLYCLSITNINCEFRFYTANTVVPPSYVSLESALRYHRLMPGAIYDVTSMTTRKKITYKTSIGRLFYRFCSESRFWGFQVVEYQGHKLQIAEPERALIDILHLAQSFKTKAHFEKMHINLEEFNRIVDVKKLSEYAKKFNNARLSRRVDLFLECVKNA